MKISSKFLYGDCLYSIKYKEDLLKLLFIKIEIPPCRRSISINEKRYFLSFPSMIFNLFVENELITASVGYKIEDNIYLCNLPNTARTYICLNNLNLDYLNKYKNKKKVENIELLCCDFLNYFWSSDFNFDTCENIDEYVSRKDFFIDENENEFIMYYKSWQKQTLENNKFKFKVKDLIKIGKESKFDKLSLIDNEFDWYEEYKKRLKTDDESYKDFYDYTKTFLSKKIIKELWENTNISLKTIKKIKNE